MTLPFLWASPTLLSCNPCRKSVPAETYARLKKQWKDLYRRHQEFRNIILGHLPQDVVIGERTFSKMEVNVNLDGTMPNISLMEQELVSVPSSGTGLHAILSAVSLKSECSCQKGGFRSSLVLFP